MKKALASITIFFYFIFSCGVVINQRYCMGKFQSFQLYSLSNDECGLCGMHMDNENGCCHDVVKIIKLQDDQNKVTISYSIKGIEPLPVTTSEYLFATYININETLHTNTNSPPLLTGQDICLQNCVFRI